MAKKKKKATRKGPNLFSLAAKNKTFKAAKRAEAKASARAKKAWKKSLAAAKRKLKSGKRK